jgi:glutathione peroxidase
VSELSDFVLPGIDGQPLEPIHFEGKVVLVINVASRCGLTPQYVQLEALSRRYDARGFEVLGIPCNQFGAQEPGNESEILRFCTMTYGITFPLAAKIDVNGPQRHPLYQWLAGEGAAFPGDIQWNFEKFLIGRDGRVVARFSPTVRPDAPELIDAIERALDAAVAL